MEWNDDWRKELKESNYDVWERLCDCYSTKNDVVLMASLMHKYNEDKTAQDCFERMIEWCCDWNSQVRLYDIIDVEYYELLKKVS